MVGREDAIVITGGGFESSRVHNRQTWENPKPEPVSITVSDQSVFPPPRISADIGGDGDRFGADITGELDRLGNRIATTYNEVATAADQRGT